MNDTQIIQGLLLCKGINRKTIIKLYHSLGSFSDTDEILRFLYQTANVKSDYFNRNLLSHNISLSSKITEDAAAQGIQIISIADSLYPKRLRLINDPPAILYIKGNLIPFETSPNIAIIGTREPTPHGQKIAERLGYQFAQRGCGIVSGLANGCDTFAHQGCLLGNGKALAILPGGLDRIYPASNRTLAHDILEHDGALVSEYSPGTKPFKSYYVDRDRLQSAFSEIVVVVETNVEGGTMHTVEFTIQQKKVLAAYRHPDKYLSFPQCHGNMKLINQGDAIPIDSEDTLTHLVNTAKESIKNSIIPDKSTPEPEQLSFFNS